MEKTFIQNRKGQRVAVVVDVAQQQKGVAFVMHGLGGFMAQPHIQEMGRAFYEQGFTTVLFDTTNTFGESDGSYEDATTTNYYEDLEDVIEWAKDQPWGTAPFVLSGHSLGGICSIVYAERHPDAVRALAPISPVISGALSVEAHLRVDPEYLSRWEASGWQEQKSESSPGRIKRLKWSHVADRLRYDVLPDAQRLTMPVLLVVGELDTSTPPDHVRKLYDVLPGAKTLHIIKGAPHTFRSPEDIAELKATIAAWAGAV